MKRVKLNEITGTEILARPIMTNNYKELLSEGVCIRKEYVSKLQDLGITEVYIKERVADESSLAILKEEINILYKEKVQEIISKHTYQQTDDMIEIGNMANNIICDIMQKEEVIEQIFDIKERTADIYEHSISTCALATLVALKMRFSREKVYAIGVGCLLHDLGIRYLAFDFDYIDFENLTENETQEYKKHPIYGYTAVRNEDWLLRESKDIILSHHERIDGMGYPLHISNLSMETKIASVCDFFDESICGIGCKRMKVYEVVEYLKSMKGKEFDEKVVDVLLQFIAVYPSGSKVVTNEGETAVVIGQNKGFPERPTLRILTDKDGNQLDNLIIKDLLKYNYVFIDKVLN